MRRVATGDCPPRGQEIVWRGQCDKRGHRRTPVRAPRCRAWYPDRRHVFRGAVHREAAAGRGRRSSATAGVSPAQSACRCSVKFSWRQYSRTARMFAPMVVCTPGGTCAHALPVTPGVPWGVSSRPPGRLRHFGHRTCGPLDPHTRGAQEATANRWWHAPAERALFDAPRVCHRRVRKVLASAARGWCGVVTW